MQWLPIKLTIKSTSQSEDELGNLIYETIQNSDYVGRYTEFNQTDFQMLGYETYSDVRKILIPNFDRNLARLVTKITVENEVYNVDSYKDLRKYGLFYISRYRK
ncbi:hypothetical protein SG586P1_00011 [Streptococcus phage SG586P1]|nr:hypothetical protein SG586P1_00011 [Streptococcus phage SG586P1]WAX18032.1 hypothetical protein SG586P3_00027 [Streptococcus phage SG586P3]